MATKELIQADLKEAMRSGDSARRDTIRLLLTAIKNAEIDRGGPLEQAELDRLLQKEAKQRRDSISEYERGGRSDLMASEQAELVIIEAYLPKQMSVDEVRAVVREQIQSAGATGPNDIGKVMGPLMARLRGQADGALVQRVVRELLTGQTATSE